MSRSAFSGGGAGVSPYVIFPGCRPPAAPHAMDDEFDGASLDPKWTWLNQNGNVVSFRDSHILMTGSGAGGVPLLTQVAPTGDFTATIRLDTIAAIRGLWFGTSGGGWVWFGYDSQTYRIWRWTSGFAWSSTIVDGNSLSYCQFLRIKKVGNVVTFWYSQNGLAWAATGHSETVGAGQHVNPLNRLGIGGAQSANSQLSFDFFRVTEP